MLFRACFVTLDSGFGVINFFVYILIMRINILKVNYIYFRSYQLIRLYLFLFLWCIIIIQQDDLVQPNSKALVLKTGLILNAFQKYDLLPNLSAQKKKKQRKQKRPKDMICSKVSIGPYICVKIQSSCSPSICIVIFLII